MFAQTFDLVGTEYGGLMSLHSPIYSAKIHEISLENETVKATVKVATDFPLPRVGTAVAISEATMHSLNGRFVIQSYDVLEAFEGLSPPSS